MTLAGGPLLRADENLNVALQLSVPVGRESLARGFAPVQSPPVPELPDLDVVADALHVALAGRLLAGARATMPLAVRGTPAELEALAGQRVIRVARAGKFLDLDLERDRVVVNPMLTGRFQLVARGEKAPAGTAVELAFSARSGAAPVDAAPWTADAPWVPAAAAPVIVRYKDPTQMGKVYILPAGVERPVPGRGPEEMGPDALDPTLTLEAWRERIRKHPGELKNLLRNQAFVAGIGNAYSDEILFAARLQPFRKRSTLAAEEVDDLYAAMRTTLAASVELLARARAADVREAGPGPPLRPQSGWRAMPPVRDEDHPCVRGRVPDRILPGLPALTATRRRRAGGHERLRDAAGPGRSGSARVRRCRWRPRAP